MYCAISTFNRLRTAITRSSLKSILKKLARAQRKLSCAQEGSKNRLKARKRVAKIHQKISNQRADWLHKHALGIVRQFDVVCIEDLTIKGLARTKRGTLWVKSFSDAAVSIFIQRLQEKAEWHGRRVIKVDGSTPHRRPATTVKPKPP
ncbi:RNA-guided endonuclease InsQ/TnpB family protein [Herpetosiphon sp. NSE202]|uniref:RNA-guided endonuclease InsQ/TnpB family protein n=1 Tax=Herpetosiphon sp. NSE202 TaxID=3351349 RepID=UPI003636B941